MNMCEQPEIWTKDEAHFTNIKVMIELDYRLKERKKRTVRKFECNDNQNDRHVKE